jgi:parvulin-like peptidyl-prolyl isomerase
VVGRIAGALAAVALVVAPSASASDVVTVTDPSGTRVVTSEQLDRLASLLARSVPQESKRELRAEALEALVGPLWREGAARELGVTFTDAELAAGFETYKRDGFRTEADFRAFRRSTGFSLADTQAFSRDGMFMSALEKRVFAPAEAAATDAAIDAYIAKHGPVIEPERRDFRFIYTITRAQAVRARAALERGAPWSQVARRYAHDRKVWRMDDQLEDATRKVDRAAFDAARGRVVGPVNDRGDYYVLRVSRIRPAAPLPAERTRRIVRQRLVNEALKGIVPEWETAATATWKARTTCAPAYDWYTRCGNWDGTEVGSIESEFLWLD